jgi:hypothetical protein
MKSNVQNGRRFQIEKLEARIAPTACCCCCDDGHGKPPVKGNNGVGNGLDPQPPGNPPINDGPGTGPGNPGNRGGH